LESPPECLLVPLQNQRKGKRAMLRYVSKIPCGDDGRSKKSAFRSIPQGKTLRLRQGAFRQLNDREWIFNKMENDTVFLIHESRAYGIAVKISDIDWAGV
jgi:hypothetical protein